MADLTITASGVVPSSGSYQPSVIAYGIAGATITAGVAIYLDATTSTWKLADADLSAAAALAKGISLNAALSGQPVAYTTGGIYTPGATLVKGMVYCASATAGLICPIADLTTGAHPCILFYALSTTQAFVMINPMLDTAGAQITL